MLKTIEERMLSIEQELSQIRKEMEDEVARYKQSGYPFDVDKIKNLLKIEGDWFNNGSVGQPWRKS